MDFNEENLEAGKEESSFEVDEKGDVIFVDKDGSQTDDDGTSKDNAGNSGTGEHAVDDIPSEFMTRYSGKSKEEIIKQVYKDQQMISRQANEVGALRKKAEGAGASENASAKYANKQKEKARLEKQLSELDDIMDSEKTEKLKKKLQEVDGELKGLEQSVFDEKVDLRVRQNLNGSKLKSLKQELTKDYGLQLEAGDWEKVEEQALNMAGQGEISRQHILSSVLLEVPGSEQLIRAASEQSARDAIADASGRRTPIGGNRGSGGSRKVPIANLKKSEIVKRLGNMSDGDLDKLIAAMESKS